MSAAITKAFTALLLSTYGYCQGVELTPCRNNVMEVSETSGTTSITCSGLNRTQDVAWTVMYANSNVDSLGQCDGVTASATSSSCSAGSVPGLFTATRPTPTTSVMTINPSALNTGPAYVSGNTLTCSQPPFAPTVCKMDYVYLPDTVFCSAQFLTPSDAAWSVSGRCDVTKVYSYLGRYTCQWYHQRGSSPETPLGQKVPIRNSSVTDGKYINGSCDVTTSFPVGDGQYSYRVVITPGGLSQNASFTGNSLIRQPSPTHNCPHYVTDGQTQSCTCSDDVGRPPGVAQWSSTQSPQLTVTSAIAGQQQTCHVIYNNKTVSPVTYTVERAYGPSNVAITGTSPFDTNGSQNLALNCTVPGGSNPAPTFQWTRPPRPDVIHRAQTYTFQPQVSDDGVQLSCTARNTFTSASDTDTFPVNLNYPPDTDPAITDNSTDSHLYQGDSVTLTCGVEGGKPLNATTLTFTCPGKGDGPDITGSTMVSSTVTFTSLSSDDHDEVCTCRTKWKTTDWYSKTSTRKLFVNSPPSIPTIQAPSGVSEYPFIATVTRSATLTCDSSTPGRPAATYTWPVNHGGREGTDVSGRGTLTFETISKEHDGKTVSCRAVNRYTANRQPVPNGTLTLEVYYHPEVHLVPVTDNQCQPLTSDPSHCLVTEGQRVHFRCQATSKPTPNVFTWQPGGGNNTYLDIESANRTLHTGTFNCSVETGLGSHGNDPRLPLRNSMLLTVLVKYATAISSLTVNSVTSVNLTVNVSDTVTLTCRGDGRPSPEMTLFNTTKDAIGHIPQGTPSLEDKVTEVTGNVTAQCRDTGIYTCEASNGVGEKQTRRVTVFVRCKPEVLNRSGDEGSMEISSVDFVTKAVRLNFHFAAYPTPWLSDIRFFPQRPNATSVGKPVKGNTIQVACSRHSVDLFNVTCTVTVDNITSTDAGFYQAMIGNDLDAVKVLFRVTTNATTPRQSSEFPVAAAAAGIAAGVLVIGGIALFLVLWKRRKGKRKEENPRRCQSEDASRRDTPEMIDNVIYDSSGSKDEVMIVNDIYGTSGYGNEESRAASNCGQQSSPYEDVDVTKAKPNILPKPKAKMSAPSAGPSQAESSDVYAFVKKKTTPDQSSKANSESAENISKPGGKSKAGNKSKHDTVKSNGKGKHKANAKGDKQPLHPADTPGSVYSNMTPLSMSPPHTEGTVYENYAFNKDDVDGNETDQNRAEEQSEMVNPDGLVYTTIAFSTDQQRRAQKPPPERETTEYAGIDFTKHVAK